MQCGRTIHAKSVCLAEELSVPSDIERPLYLLSPPHLSYGVCDYSLLIEPTRLPNQCTVGPLPAEWRRRSPAQLPERCVPCHHFVFAVFLISTFLCGQESPWEALLRELDLFTFCLTKDDYLIT
jgi:hypothetical protein